MIERRPRADDAGSRRLALTGFIAGPAAFVVLFWLTPIPSGLGAGAWSVACVTVLMAIWWFTQAIPLAATALLPALMFPLLGVSGLAEATSAYAHPLIFLFFGGFVVALTIQRWNLHRRLALAAIASIGSGPGRVVAGFMLVTAGLSMWVSNTATTLMMVPIALSVIDLSKSDSGCSPGHERFARGLLVSVAYAASIGGIATLIGTPPNAVLAAYMSNAYGVHIGFAAWMAVGVPVAGLLLVVAWFLICRVFFPAGALRLFPIGDALVAGGGSPGPMERGERLAALLLLGVGLMWMLQPLISRYVSVSDTGIALGAALLAFCIPVRFTDRVFLMDWKHAKHLPWEILLLFGGGLSLALAINATGLSSWIGAGFATIGGTLLIGGLFLMVLGVIFLTEITSNTATAAIFVPIAAALAGSYGVESVVFAAPVALAASCAFMMPVATPPNAIVFAAGRLSVLNMCVIGFFLNLISAVLIVVAAVYLVPNIF